MLVTVAADHEAHRMVKLLEIDECSGSIRISFVDITSQDDLLGAAEMLNDGTSFADFQVVEVPDAEKKGSILGYELRHSCSNITDMAPDLDLDLMVVEDSPSFLGLIRKIISDDGKIVLPLNNVPEQNIPSWMVASANNLQISKEMKGYISYLYPSTETTGAYRWGSAPIFWMDKEEKFNDITNLTLLISTEFNLGPYSDYVTEVESKNVLNEEGTFVTTYRAIKVKPNLPVFGKKSNLLMQSSIISRFKFIADSYKLALYQLVEGLFEEKTIEASDRVDEYAPRELGRHVYIASKPAVNKNTSMKMIDYLFKELLNEERISLHEFNKSYPHYEAFSSIIRNELTLFHDEKVTKNQKIRRYHQLKNVETQLYILMNECLYHAMFDNNSFQFNYWGDTGSFRSDIPNYKVSLGGGGGKWRPNLSLF